MSRPVEEWLESFQCEEYAESFESLGYKTLESLRLIDAHKLQALGIKPQHKDTIIQELSNLGVAMPCIDNLQSFLQPAVSVSNSLSTNHENAATPQVMNLSSALIPGHSVQPVSTLTLATTDPLIGHPSSSPPVNSDKDALPSITPPRRIVVLPLRNQIGAGMGKPRVSPVKASCFVSNPSSAPAPVVNCGLPTAEHGMFFNTSPIKQTRQPIATFIMDSSSSSSSSSSSAFSDNDDDSRDVNAESNISQSTVIRKLPSAAVESIVKSLSPEFPCGDVQSARSPILGSSKFEPCPTEREIKVGLNHEKDSNKFEVTPTLGEASSNLLQNHSVIDVSTSRSQSLLVPRQVFLSATAVGTRSSIVCSGSSSTSSSQGKRFLFRESVSASTEGFSKSAAGFQRSPIKISPVNANYSCVVTSSGGVSKIIFIPSASVNNSRGVSVSCSPIKSDDVFQFSASKVIVATSARSDSTVTTINSVPIMNVKQSGKYPKDVKSSFFNCSVDTKTDELKFVRNSAIHSTVRVDNNRKLDAKSCEQSSYGGLKLASPLISLSNNSSSSGARIVLLRKVDSANCNRMSNSSPELKAVASASPSRIVSPVICESEATLISDDDSSDSILVLDADTLLPTDKSPSIVKQCAPAKDKVILLNRKIAPVRSVSTRRTPGDSKENGLAEELGRGKRKRKSKLLTRFLETGRGGGKEIPGKVTKPINKNVLVTKGKSEVLSSSRCKKKERSISVSPKVRESRLSVPKVSQFTPNKRCDVKIVEDISPRPSCQKALCLESSSKKLPVKNRWLSKKLDQMDPLQPEQRSLDVFPKAHSQPETYTKNKRKKSSELVPWFGNGLSNVLHSSCNKNINRLETVDSGKTNNVSAVSALDTTSSELPRASCLSSAQSSPPLSKLNKSMKMDVTNEDGIVESLVVEIVDISSSDDDEVADKGTLLKSVNNSSEVTSRIEKPEKTTKLDSSSSQITFSIRPPLVSTEVRQSISCTGVLGGNEKTQEQLHNSRMASNAMCSEKLQSDRSFKARRTFSDINPRSRLIGSEHSSAAKDVNASSTLIGASQKVASVPGHPSVPLLVSPITFQLPKFHAPKLHSMEKSLSLANHGKSSLTSLEKSDLVSPEKSSTRITLSLQNHLASPLAESAQRSTDVVQYHQTKAHISADEILSVEKSPEKNIKKCNELKMNRSGSKQQLQRNKRPGQKRRHCEVGSGAFGDDEDYTIHVKRLNRKYGSSQRRSRPLPVHLKVSRPEAEADSKTYTGPIVRVRGVKEHPVSCLVVAGECDIDEETTVKPKKKPLHSEHSRLSLTFQLDDSVPWLCVFCHRTSSYRSIGDLFGPYCCKAPENAVRVGLAECPTAKDKLRLVATKSPQIKQQQSGLQLQRKLRVQKYAPVASNASAESSHNSLDFSSIDTLPSEIWVHEECAVWTTGVYMLGSKLHGLEEAAVIALQSVCSICETNGATLGCYVKGCCLKYHFLCARDAGCAFNDENFTIFCTKHKSKKTTMMSAAVSPS